MLYYAKFICYFWKEKGMKGASSGLVPYIELVEVKGFHG